MERNADMGDFIFARLRGWPWELRSPREFWFLLRFPHEDGARAAAEEVRFHRLTPQVYPGDEPYPDEWYCLGRGTFVLADTDPGSLNDLGRFLTELAGKLGGRFSSWDAAVQPMEEAEIRGIEVEETCRRCGSLMQVRRSGTGFFIGCTMYPQCRATIPAPRELLQRLGASPFWG